MGAFTRIWETTQIVIRLEGWSFFRNSATGLLSTVTVRLMVFTTTIIVNLLGFSATVKLRRG